MAKPRKKVSNPPKYVSPSTTKIEVNQFLKTPVFNGNFDIWAERMRNFLKTQGTEVWKSVIVNSMNGLPNSMKVNFEKCSSAKGISDEIHDLHSKGTLTMISSQENDGKQKGNPEPIKEGEDKSDNIKAKEDLEDEENEKYFEEDLLSKLMAAMEEMRNLRR